MINYTFEELYEFISKTKEQNLDNPAYCMVLESVKEIVTDDYKISIEILKFKINAILKRIDIKAKKLFIYKDLKIDFDSKKVYKRNEEIKLSATEYKLLELLCKNKGIAMTKEVLLDKLWDYNGNYVDDNTLSVNVRRLRKKIEDDPKNPEYIVTLFGIGYMLGE